MKIIAKIKDYYDGAVRNYGMDSKCVFVRKCEELNIGHKEILSKVGLSELINTKNLRDLYHNTIMNRDKFIPFVLLFAGKSYIGGVDMRVVDGYYWPLPKDYFYGEDMIDIRLSYKDIRMHEENKRMVRNLEYLMSKYHGKDIPSDIFIKYNTPYILVPLTGYIEINQGKNVNTYRNPVKNILLNGIKFYKIFDIYQTFNEIYYFLLNVVYTRENDIIEPSDNIKILTHGYDKWSFRKMPEKK